MEAFEEVYQISFEIISDAGDARSKALQSIKASNGYKFEEAENLLITAKENLKKAHKTQTKLIQREANNEKIEMNVVLVHSQDHFSMAICAIDMAEQAMIMNKKIYELIQK